MTDKSKSDMPALRSCVLNPLRSLKPADLSSVHPLKRVLLIALAFLFGVSIALAISMQFVWFDAAVLTPRLLIDLTLDARGLLLVAQAEQFSSPHRSTVQENFQKSALRVSRHPVACHFYSLE